jgi:hypothetical protein
MLRESEENLAPRDGQSVETELEGILRQRIEDLEAGDTPANPPFAYLASKRAEQRVSPMKREESPVDMGFSFLFGVEIVREYQSRNGWPRGNLSFDLRASPMSEPCIELILMSPQLSSELIRSLRVTLQKIDEDFPSQADEPVVAALKRLLLLRVAELESVGTDKSNSTDEPEGVESGSVVWLRLRSG